MEYTTQLATEYQTGELGEQETLEEIEEREDDLANCNYE